MLHRTRKISLQFSLLLAVLLTVGLAGCGSSSSGAGRGQGPDPEPSLNFVGPDRCGACHVDAHGDWENSWHTKKTTYGPNWPGKAAEGEAKFLPGVIAMWEDGKIDSYMILDRATLTDADKAAGITNKNYVTIEKFDWTDVDIIVGETRKQRYAVYYDGGPRQAYYATSKNGGIGWTVDTSTAVEYPGNRERAGYKFLTIEIDALKDPAVPKSNMYGEFYSWQERCIGCHTTGFDAAAWDNAKADFVAGNRADLKDLFIADIRISCESCHGAGAMHAESRRKADIINPAKLTGTDRMLACNQCHTRTSGTSPHNDNRYLTLGQDDYMDKMNYVRPAWGKGSRAVSIDGKGRRDHQQDMDILLTKYIHEELERGTPGNPHGSMSCFDCHDAHGVGNDATYSTASVDKKPFTTGGDPNGTLRLKGTREQVCGSCHAGQVDEYLAVLNGTTGWPSAGFGNYANERGRGDKKQHIFATNSEGQSFGLYPEEYIWALTGSDKDDEKSYRAIWPWERELYQASQIVYGPAPWNGDVTDGQRTPVVAKAGFTGPGTCVACHKTTHNEWKDSWHTKKTTYGPAFGDGEHFATGKAKFLPGIIAMWEDGKIDSYKILDSAPRTDADKAAGITNKNYVTVEKFDWTDVDIIVGETRKQRYAVYYDGGPRQAYYATSKNGGIGWTVDTSTAVEYPGNRERAGYKFLTIEIDALKNPAVPKSNMYGERFSWQERCIGCHTTGFDAAAWDNAKADFVSGNRADLKDLFIADIRISCESCHGPGADHVVSQDRRDIINPEKLTGTDRMLACNQCHTRTSGTSPHNDNRFLTLGQDDYMDKMNYYRPAWGKGDRGVSIDGKGRRDHQQDMDILLTKYIHEELQGRTSYHGNLACFDCHNAHGVGTGQGYTTEAVDKKPFTTAGDPDGTLRLKGTREQMCGSCHGPNIDSTLDVLNGATGWPAAGFGNYANERGRGDRKQHIFSSQQYFDANGDRQRRSFGLAPEEYIWALTGSDPAAEASYKAIWPWERELYQASQIVYGATPWDQLR